jgi:opacity protein-like surface antigen
MIYIKKYAILMPIMLLLTTIVWAQEAANCTTSKDRNELGVITGATYYMGDFNPNLTPLKNPSFYGGIMYRYTLKSYFALRAQVGFGYLKGNAKGMDGLLIDSQLKDWAFHRPWLFADIVMEFNFMPYNAADIRKKQRFTPFMLLGVGASGLFSDDNKSTVSTADKSDDTSLFIDIPIGIGAKWCVAQRVTLGIEWLFRVSFNDEIDFYKGTNEAHSPIINNDWIGTIGITVSYLFKEERPCAAQKRHRPSNRYYRGPKSR